jgi:hypothetical protein
MTTDTAEIISGERVQRLAELTIISRRTYEFHRGVTGYASEMLMFEHGMDELDGRAIDRLCNARSLFLYTHDVDEFIDVVWPRLATRPSILVTHNSDGEISLRHAEWLDHEGIGVSYWLAQNATVSHPRVHPVPIGVANSMWPHGDIRSLARAMRRAQRNRREPVSLFTQFNASTHPSRAAAADALRANFPQRVVDPAPSLRWRQYLELLGAHQFSACPRGNGIDTHRIWESLYLGVVPVVERTELSEHWRGCGMPLVLIDDWSEVTPERLSHEAERLKLPWSPNSLQMSTYRAAIEAALATAGSRPREARDADEGGDAARATHTAD